MQDTITQHQIKYLKNLHLKKYRQKYSQFLIEGHKIINEFKKNGYFIPEIYCTHQNYNLYESFLDSDLFTTNVNTLERFSAFKSREDVIALVDFKQDLPVFNSKTNSIWLDNISDPGNLGAIMRIAAWYGIKQLVLSPNTVDEFNPKVIAASMGAASSLSIIRQDLIEIAEKCDQCIYACVLDGSSVYEIKEKKAVVKHIVIGSESHGINAQLLERNNVKKIAIPKRGDFDSLNAAVATGIIIDRLLTS